MARTAIAKKQAAAAEPLPEYQEPQSIENAKSRIYNLGRNMAEHAYLVGKDLAWVKEQLPHGKFLKWIEENVWFTAKTAENFMMFANQCDQEGYLLPDTHYKTSKSKNLRICQEPLPEGVFLYNLWQLEPHRIAGYGDGSFHGVTPVEVCAHTLRAYCPKDGRAYDSMVGSGTFPEVAETLSIKCDASDLADGIDAADTGKPDNLYDLVFNHYAYWNMVVYSKDKQDLSQAPTRDSFLDRVRAVFAETYRILKPDGFYCVMMGDRREAKRTIWLTTEFPRIGEEVGFVCYDNAYISTLGTEHQSSGLAEYRAKKFRYMKPAVDWFLAFQKGRS